MLATGRLFHVEKQSENCLHPTQPVPGPPALQFDSVGRLHEAAPSLMRTVVRSRRLSAVGGCWRLYERGLSGLLERTVDVASASCTISIAADPLQPREMIDNDRLQRHVRDAAPTRTERRPENLRSTPTSVDTRYKRLGWTGQLDATMTLRHY